MTNKYSIGIVYGDQMTIVFGNKQDVNGYIMSRFNNAVMKDYTRESILHRLKYYARTFPNAIIHNIEELLQETA